MESDEYGNDSKAERKFARIALVETIQKTGYDETSENRALDQPLVRGGDMFNCVPTDVHSGDKALCYVSCTRVRGALTDA